MKKLLTAVLLCFVVFLAGCKNNNPSSSTNGNLLIMVQMERSDTYGSTTPMILYSADLMDFSTMSFVSGGTVTVSGPGKVTTMAEISTGVFMFSSTDPLDYQCGQNYTVSVCSGGVTYSANAIAPGSITFTAGCLVMIWTYDGNYNLVQVTDPSSTQHQFGPTPSATDPFDMNANGAFTWGSGTYGILVNAAKNISGAFSGAHSSSALVIENNLGGIPVTK